MVRDDDDHRPELLEYAGRVAATDEEQTVYDAMADTADHVLAFDSSVVETESDGFLEVRAWAGQPPDVEGIPVDEGVAGHTYKTGESERVADVLEDARVDDSEDTTLRSVLSVPIGDVGVFQAGRREQNAFDDEDVELAELLASHAAQAVERIRSQHELRHEHNRLAALFENIPSPTASFVIENGDPVVRSVNPAFERVFGYPAAELEGEAIDQYIVPEGSEERADQYNDNLQQGRTVNAEVRRLTADGPRDFLLDVVPLRLGESNVQGFAMYTDITSRREHERELERQNDRLDEFASIVSHDLRNPLNVARGYLELAEETENADHFEAADEALGRMNDIIGSVLELAREGRSLNETTDVELADAAARAWRNVETERATLELPDGRVLESGDATDADASGGTVSDASRETAETAATTTLEADPSRLGSLLENLFRNSVEHGGADVSVLVESTNEGFAVADDGPGIPPEHRDEVFESGVTTADDGTGFGLAIVESIADAHGWTVSVTASQSGGTRFVFET
ncbi:ATP-binding protein [Halobacterium zhouii]|uniref:GAF domain-containing sensor histidine kinase n=1 Tax=Halobacterium zhouii TaxID=2902624 RepID=UPI001E3F5B2D|nr:ATP-binding protein [Halobacterium zhouii]